MTDRIRDRLRGATSALNGMRPSLHAAKVLLRDYGHLKSARTDTSTDAAGNPLPWYTYPAIEYLKQLDFRDKTVFEYGSGYSTLFWGSIARRVMSVEDNERWFEIVSRKLPENCQLHLETDLERFVNAITQTGDQFDVIVVDGPARGGTRLKCCRAARPYLRPGGVMILDNSDYLPKSSEFLRDSGLLEVDMTGFVPIGADTQTTSFYFHREFNVSPRGPRQPMHGIGARPLIWEKPFVPIPGTLVEFEDEKFRAVTRDDVVRFASQSGPRAFRLLVYVGGDDLPAVAILDLDRQRVLVNQHRPPDRRSSNVVNVETEFETIRRMSWETFRAFVVGHERRRYIPEP